MQYNVYIFFFSKSTSHLYNCECAIINHIKTNQLKQSARFFPSCPPETGRKRRHAVGEETIPQSPCCQKIKDNGYFIQCLAGYGPGIQGYIDGR